MMHASYPIQLRLRGLSVLVVGAGKVAARKLARLVTCGAHIRVISTHVSAAVAQLAADHSLVLEARAFRDDDVQGAFLVIAATDNEAVNTQVARAARNASALVLRVDAPDDSDFTLPALTSGEHLEATISTRGKAPAASRRLSRELARWLKHGPERFAEEVARARASLSGRADGLQRMRALADGELFDACCARDEAKIASLVNATLEAP